MPQLSPTERTDRLNRAIDIDRVANPYTVKGRLAVAAVEEAGNGYYTSSKDIAREILGRETVDVELLDRVIEGVVNHCEQVGVPLTPEQRAFMEIGAAVVTTATRALSETTRQPE